MLKTVPLVQSSQVSQIHKKKRDILKKVAFSNASTHVQLSQAKLYTLKNWGAAHVPSTLVPAAETSR